MPFVDLVSPGDYASIWYRTNSPNGHVGSFDLSKPTIVLLHPLYLDITFMYPQLEDPRLYTQYNIILFDTRATGKSLYRPSGKHDLWVTAADLAAAFYHLNIPPAHIFAPELYGLAVLRLAALFPELVLSVSLCNVPGQTEVKGVFDALGVLMQLWSYAEDLPSFELACKEIMDFFMGSEAHPDLMDEMVAYWETHYPPFRRTHVCINVELQLNRTPLSEEQLAAITCPVLIMQAERSTTHPFSVAEALSRSMVNVPGGVTIFPVKTSVAYMSILCSSIVNQVFHKFISRQPHTQSEFKGYTGRVTDNLMRGLHKLARFKGDPSIAQVESISSLSFSCLAPEVIQSQLDSYATYLKGASEAFSPLTAEGRPIRKYSERNDHWLEPSSDGFSYSSNFIAKYYKKKVKGKDKGKTMRADEEDDDDDETVMRAVHRRRLDHHDPFVLAPSEPVSEEALEIGRLRRAHINVNPGAVDRHVIKGSMAKVISGGRNINIPRLLR